MNRGFGTLLVGFFLVASFVRSDDDIYFKGAKTTKNKSAIASESAKGVVLKNGQKIPAEDIEDIFYELTTSPVLATLSYRNAFTAERDWLAAVDAKKRAASFAEAVDKYQKAAQQISEPRVKGHLDFKLGYLRGKKAQEDGGDPKAAIAALNSYVKAYPNTWAVTRALTLLANLQNDSKDYAGAEQSFAELLKLDVSDDVKNDAKLQGALANIYLGKHAVAEAKLAELVKTLPKGSKAYGRALVAQSECLLATNKTDEAVGLLRAAIKESPDKSLRAVAYNALGANYYKADQFKEALWEFLWVDVNYNQDRNEHAKALYYLSHIFDRIADTDKAAQSRAALLDASYAGTEWQRRLQKEQGK
jgi:tetratricopeptide (TPR) repeat protein